MVQKQHALCQIRYLETSSIDLGEVSARKLVVEHKEVAAMYGHSQEKIYQPQASMDTAPRPSLLRRILARRRVRQFERRCRARDQLLAWRVQEVIAARGLTSADYSIAGGRAVHVPRVVAVSAGPPKGLDVELLSGQVPDDFAAHASAMAYSLGVADVRVIPLGPSRIRLELIEARSMLNLGR